ncbi:unnamed protein product [Adineta ricciae]|uniref:Uncharacterized protein n=1 Tax=Adineta ricciae TaxID=249248 RepID=A0A814PI73_ADIRI|nr:unnamed protein product [Adineta ricciae]CAF1320602.1 unnamed protein product [Adineta ricciae]
MKLCIVAALVVLLSVSAFAAKPLSLGSLCLNPVNCFVNPCQFSRCAAHPNAVCTANYCGGCNAIWSVGGRRVDCTEADEVEARKCVMVNCFMDPCGLAKCPNHPEARCRADYCGGCNARFYNAAGQRVQCN